MVKRIIKKMTAKSRVEEYEHFLKHIVRAGYSINPLCKWPGDIDTYFLRHDVDKDPQAALLLGRILAEYGHGSFYFRWQTMDAGVMNELNCMGHEVSLHYETLANLFRRYRVRHVKDMTFDMIREGEEKLGQEIELFRRLFLPIKTITSHGQVWNRKTGILNTVLRSDVKDVTSVPHNTDTLEISVNRCTLIHPCHWVVTNKLQRLIADLRDKF